MKRIIPAIRTIRHTPACFGFFPLLAFFFLSASAFGHTVAEGDSSSIVVHVLHQGRPVAGAEVYRIESKNYFRDGVYAASTCVGQTGEDGAVSVPVRMEHGRVMGGPYLFARIPGRFSGFTGIFRYSDPDSVVVHLFPSRTVSGVVRDDRGRPVPDAEITIWIIEGNGTAGYNQISLYGTAPGSSAKSDARGRFILSGIPETSRINIFVAAPGKATLCVRDIPSGMKNLDIRPDPESRITGRVTFENGEPVNGIDLELFEKFFSPWSSGGASCRTDSDGRYVFEHLFSGMYRIQAYPDSTLGNRVAPPLGNIGVGRGKTAEHMDIKLVRGIPLTGMVVEEENGAPVPGVQVSAGLIAANPSDSPNGEIYTPLGSGRTDGKGIYRLTVLPGDVQVGAVAPEGFAQGSRQQRVTVDPQDSLVVGVNMAVARGKKIKGVIKFPDGTPAPEVEIFCGFFTEAYTDSTGVFTLNGIRSGGEIHFLACTRKREMEASFAVNVDSASTVEVFLHPAEFVSMEGIVVDSQEKPVPGIAVNLGAGSGMPPIDYGTTTATTDTSGRFMMNRIRAGRYYHFTVRDGLAGSDSFFAGKDNGPIRIVLPQTDRWIGGVVKDAAGKPLAGMKVDAWGEKGHAETTTGKDGRYHLEGLASEKISLNFRGVQGLYRFEEVTTNRRHDFTLPTGRHYLSGQVTDVRRDPIAGALVTIIRKEEGERPLVVETDSGGRFYLSNLGYAAATITVSGPGWREQTLRVWTDREDIRFRLEKAGRE